MGTNFYARIPIRKRPKCIKLIDDIKEKIENDKANKYDVQDFCYQLQEEFKGNYVHLGKRSYGWAFCWDLNEMKFYEPTLISIKKFIEDNDAVIVDEYGNDFTWKQFIDDEIGNCLHPQYKNDSKKYYTHRTYHYDFYDKNTYFSHNQKYKSLKLEQYAKDGFVDYDFDELITKENLRFVLYTDFS